MRDADLLITDAQYTAEEFPQKIGWGHSTVEHAVDFAVVAGVKQLALSIMIRRATIAPSTRWSGAAPPGRAARLQPRRLRAAEGLTLTI